MQNCNKKQAFSLWDGRRRDYLCQYVSRLHHGSSKSTSWKLAGTFYLQTLTHFLIDLTGTTVFWLTRNLWCSICRSILNPLTRRCPMPEPSTWASHGAMHLSCGDNARGRRSRRRMRCPQPKYWRSPMSVCPHHLGPGRSTTYPRANLPDGQTTEL